MSKRQSRWECLDCGQITKTSKLLVAAHPFDPLDEVNGCPACRGMEFAMVCDEPGCVHKVSCGTPTADGYRSTCGAHKPEAVRR